LSQENLDVIKKNHDLVQKYKSVFDSVLGSPVLWDILNQAGMLSVSHTVGDSHTTAFNEGRRSLALHILQKLDTDELRLRDIIKKGQEHELEQHSIFGDA